MGQNGRKKTLHLGKRFLFLWSSSNTNFSSATCFFFLLFSILVVFFFWQSQLSCLGITNREGSRTGVHRKPIKRLSYRKERNVCLHAVSASRGARSKVTTAFILSLAWTKNYLLPPRCCQNHSAGKSLILAKCHSVFYFVGKERTAGKVGETTNRRNGFLGNGESCGGLGWVPVSAKTLSYHWMSLKNHENFIWLPRGSSLCTNSSKGVGFKLFPFRDSFCINQGSSTMQRMQVSGCVCLHWALLPCHHKNITVNVTRHTLWEDWCQWVNELFFGGAWLQYWSFIGKSLDLCLRSYRVPHHTVWKALPWGHSQLSAGRKWKFVRSFLLPEFWLTPSYPYM